MAKSLMDDLQSALTEYPWLPQDVWIGRNGPADKVRWLIRRLLMFEEQQRQQLKAEAGDGPMPSVRSIPDGD